MAKVRAVAANRARDREQPRNVPWHVLIAASALAVAATLHVALLVSLDSGSLNFLFNDAENRLGRGSDFFAVYGAGHNFLHGASVYATVDGDSTVPYAYPFRYLPFMAFSIGAIVSVMPAWTAYWSWVAITEILLLINVALTWRFAPNTRWSVIGTCMWLLFTPYYLELYMGQFSFVMASLFFWLGLTLRSLSKTPAMTSWTASLLVKTNSLLFLPFLWKLHLGRGVAIGLALVLVLNVPYFLAVDGSWDAWSGNFRSLEENTVFDPHAGNLGLVSLLHLPTVDAGEGPLERTAVAAARLPWSLAILAVAGAATLLACFTHRLRLLALWTCTYFLVFGEVWEHHYVMLLPVLVLLVLFDEKLRVPALATYVFVALPTPYALLQTSVPPLDFGVSDPQSYWSTAGVYAQHLSKVLPTALLWLALVLQVSQGDRRGVGDNVSFNLRTTESRVRRRLLPAR